MIHYITTQGLGQPWVGTELNVVRTNGVPFVLHAMRRPQIDMFDSEWAAQLNRDTRFLYPLPVLGMTVTILMAPALFGGRFIAALANALFGRRESFRARVSVLAHFFVACHWARGLRRETVSHIHSQWIHSSGTIGMYGAWLLDVSFSFTGHAVDLFRDRVAFSDKVRRADFIVCISSFHRDFYLEHGAREDKLFIAFCGVDPSLFHPKPKESRDGRPFRLRASGRLVEKKGFTYLIEACKSLVERDEDIECLIGGSGPLEDALRRQVVESGLSERVTLTGQALKQEDIPAFMHGGDLYCLPCVWAADNDVDGLPQMLMEAMGCGLPVISTRLVGIPDLVVDGETGLLVEPNDAVQLADAIQRIIHDEVLAERLALAGRKCIEGPFDVGRSLDTLIEHYRARLGVSTSVAASPGDPQGEASP